MYQVGQEEIDAITRVIRAKALFRYGVGMNAKDSKRATRSISASSISRSPRVEAMRSPRR